MRRLKETINGNTKLIEIVGIVFGSINNKTAFHVVDYNDIVKYTHTVCF